MDLERMIIMKTYKMIKKKLIQSTAVVLTAAAMMANVYTPAPVEKAAAETVTYEPTGYVTAGIVTELSTIEKSAFERAALTVDETKVSVVAASEKKETKKAAPKKSKWESRLMADVDHFVYVRKHAGKDNEIVGKLRKGDVATVVSEKGSWTKIKSGDVTGYVKTKYTVTGSEAKALYKSLDLDEMSRAISVEEEQKQFKLIQEQKAAKAAELAALAEEEAAAAEEEAVAEAPAEEEAEVTTETETTQNEAVEATVDDVSLLAALIYCEAGGEPYEGQLAVGAVVINRLNAGYASSISGVIYQPHQFGPAGSGKLARAIANGSASASCRQAAEEALSGVSNVGTCKNFHRVRNDGTSGTVIGHHIFF